MFIATYGTLLLAAAFFAHLLIWRIRLPRNHTQALLLIFLIVPVPILSAVFYANPGVWPASVWPILHLLLFYTAMSLVYVIGYSVIEQDSALLATYAKIESAGAGGMAEEELVPLLEQGTSPMQRLELMAQTGLIERRDDGYALTPKGRRLARLFALAERLFGLPRGG